MNPATRKVVDWVVGLSLLVIGVVGLFLPFLQGLIFILAGLAVLSSHSRWARAILQRLRAWGRNLRGRLASMGGERGAGRRGGKDEPARNEDRDQ